MLASHHLDTTHFEAALSDRTRALVIARGCRPSLRAGGGSPRRPATVPGREHTHAGRVADWPSVVWPDEATVRSAA
jgi:hypothetical protein